MRFFAMIIALNQIMPAEVYHNQKAEIFSNRLIQTNTCFRRAANSQYGNKKSILRP